VCAGYSDSSRVEAYVALYTTRMPAAAPAGSGTLYVAQPTGTRLAIKQIMRGVRIALAPCQGAAARSASGSIGRVRMTAGRAAGSGSLPGGKDNTRARTNHMGITQYAT